MLATGVSLAGWVGLAGCGAGAGSSAGGGALTKIQPGTAVRLHVRTGSEVDALQERIPVLESEQKIKVAIESFPGNEYYEQVQVLLASDRLGDVLWGASSTGQGDLWAHSGVIRLVDDLVKAE